MTWQSRAACANHPYLNFTDPGSQYEAQSCLLTCRQCPVKAECLAFGRSDQSATGIYGGVILRDTRYRDQRITEMFRDGNTDDDIGAAVNLTAETVREIRTRLGLTRRSGPIRKPINHGTRGGADQHRRRGERPCPECAAAELAAARARRKGVAA